MAIYGYGIWSLISKTIIGYAITSILLWSWNKWRPSYIFDFSSLKELFSFGSKLLLSGLIGALYSNIYYLVIGKYFTATELGYYTRADQFQALPSSNLQGIIARVSYPILSTIQNDIPRLREAYKVLIRSTMFITFNLMLGLAAVGKPLILTLIGEKWVPSVIYLQMLCFVGMFYPLHALNLDMLQVQGRTDLYLRLEILKKILAIPVIIMGILYGIKIMIFGMIINTLIAYYLNSFWSGRFIGYSFSAQIKDVFPSFVFASLVNLIVFFEGLLLPFNALSLLVIQLFSGGVLILFFGEIFTLKEYILIKNIFVEKFFGPKINEE